MLTALERHKAWFSGTIRRGVSVPTWYNQLLRKKNNKNVQSCPSTPSARFNVAAASPTRERCPGRFSQAVSFGRHHTVRQVRLGSVPAAPCSSIGLGAAGRPIAPSVPAAFTLSLEPLARVQGLRIYVYAAPSTRLAKGIGRRPERN